MHTLKLKINDQVYDKLIWLLGKFTKDEVEIIMDESNFNETKRYLDTELEEITSGNAKDLNTVRNRVLQLQLFEHFQHFQL